MKRELTELKYRLYYLLGEIKLMGFNELKKPAALQFRHNNSNGFVDGYEKDEMDMYLCKVYKVIIDLKSDIDNLRDDKKLTNAILGERNAEVAQLQTMLEERNKTIAELKSDYKEACDRLQTVKLIKDSRFKEDK